MFHKHHLHQLDPNWQFAQKHGKASKTGKALGSSGEQGQQDQLYHRCQCCNEHIKKDEVDLWVHSKQLQFLGFGFPLFYQFLKYCMIMLIISIGCYHSISLQLGIQQNKQLCHPQTTTSRLLSSYSSTNSYVSGSSPSSSSTSSSQSSSSTIIHCYTFLVQLARVHPQQSQIQQFIRIVSFIIQILVLIYIRNSLIKLQAYYDQRSTTVSDYSMIIKGISKKQQIRKNILQYLHKQMGNDIPNVQQIILLPPLANLQQLKQQRHHILSKLRPFYSNQNTNTNTDKHQQYTQLQKQLAIINDKITKSAQNSYQQILNDKLNCQRALIVFNTQQQKMNVLETFQSADKQMLATYFGSQHKIRFQEAPQPQEIIWENASVPNKRRLLHILIGWSLSLLVLAIVFTIFYFSLIQKSLFLQHAIQKLTKQSNNTQYKNQYNGCIALVYILMFLVVLFDKLILSTLFHKFTDLEKHSTTADLQFSFALKYAIGLFFTTALMTLAVQAIKFHNYMSHPYGVVDQQSIMFFMNSFFIPFFWLINPLRIWKIIKRKINHGKKNLTQDQANKLMQQQSYDLGKRFAQIIQMMWFVYLYSTLIPIGAVIIVAGLIFYYWVDKYNLLRRSKVQGKVSGSFIHTSLTMLDFTLLLRPLGSMFFDSQIREGAYFQSNIVMVCVAFVYLIIPKNYFIEVLNQQYFKPQEKQYKDVKNKFHRNYKTEHPLFSILSKQQIEKDKFIEEYVQKYMKQTKYQNNNNNQMKVKQNNNKKVIQIQNEKQKKGQDYSVDQQINLGKDTSTAFIKFKRPY